MIIFSILICLIYFIYTNYHHYYIIDHVHRLINKHEEKITAYK